LAVRLALAELLTKDAGQKRLVVLDDVLTATGDERLGRVIAVLEEMRSHAQFVILTFHPERYKPLKGAKLIERGKPAQLRVIDASRLNQSSEWGSVLDGAANKRFLSTRETRELVPKNVSLASTWG
jgi:hypothetical protein